METPENARTRQHAEHSANAQQLGERLAEGNTQIKDWRYVPPRSDDWEEWDGVTLWCAIDQLYRWEYIREVALAQGNGPFYCPVHEERPAPGWQPGICRDCRWEDQLYDAALTAARELGRSQMALQSARRVA